ncbi:PTS system beta-glucosides-specific IIC component/PTS system trehalose-specific IIC component [Mycoplasma testudineum]|uniref:PTS system beta-glucosides-specific IIC component/PTS system trehalose-specific IIC component n=1 Tax=Mycoplasma testudineum TaxID=244584 RepID=A0A4R6IFM7_9MOLU|nr:PTS transporter subunit EIIB [Mycoplasma testudineum]OYD27094.1 hypothetical protein CG473_00370 [Mycoplasma testudineum]TDO21153.1 PTS system beta-glucosides-specific IIC component/PTS system trehalose-specific IIC component [Mycoplasma testudineum]
MRDDQKYKKTAFEIIEIIGGADNITNAYHCASRLRFEIKDQTKAHKSTMEFIDNVKDVFQNGSELNVVIGSDVNLYFDEMIKLPGMEKFAKKPSKKFCLFKKLFKKDK